MTTFTVGNPSRARVKRQALRIYAGFGLAAITIALPPLMPITALLAILMLYSSRRARAVERRHLEELQRRRAEAELIAAMRRLP